MSKDLSADTGQVAHDEKREHPALSDGTGRRESIALNIVENPLKVFTPKICLVILQASLLFYA